MSLNTTSATLGRGCGEREEGEPYLCSGQSPFGLPIENFIIDPPLPLTAVQPSRSLYSILTINEVNHVLITVGYNHYPSAWSFIEETKRFGVSRKVPKDFPFHLLSHESVMYFAHSHLAPEGDFVPWQTPEHCNEIWRAGKHADGTVCTFACRDYSQFLHPNTKQAEDGSMRIEMPTFSFNTTNPSSITNVQTGDIFKFAAPSVERALVFKGEGDDSPRERNVTNITFKDLDSVPYIFLYTPITHVEAKDFLNHEVAQKLDELALPYVVLDY